MNNEKLKSISVIRPIFQSIKKAAKFTGISEYAIRKEINNNKIPYIKNGNKYLINMPQWISLLNKESEV